MRKNKKQNKEHGPPNILFGLISAAYKTLGHDLMVINI